VDGRPLDRAGVEPLDHIQDELAAYTSVPWPHVPELGYVFDPFEAVVEDGVLRFWYGERDRAVLAFEPLALASLDG
jgi:hypothetical protein